MRLGPVVEILILDENRRAKPTRLAATERPPRSAFAATT
jgi:hypothetical protein